MKNDERYPVSPAERPRRLRFRSRDRGIVLSPRGQSARAEPEVGMQNSAIIPSPDPFYVHVIEWESTGEIARHRAVI